MKILVCISCVPDTTSKINFTTNHSSLDKTGIQWIINPLDEYSLSKAIDLQQTKGAVITVITVGDSKTDPLIRKALAMGANNAIRINMEAKDSLSTAKEIAKIAKEERYDLILAGKESLDYNGGAVPGMISQIMDLPFVNATIGLEISEEEATITRETDNGTETIKARLPLVIAGQKGLVEEKDLVIPNMRGIMSARIKPIIVKEPSDNESNMKVISFKSLPQRSSAKIISPDNLDELVRLLHEEARVI